MLAPLASTPETVAYPLHEAIRTNLATALALLKEQPELAKVFDDNHLLPLHVASGILGREKLVELLLEIHPDAAKTLGGTWIQTPVHIAVEAALPITLYLLLQTREGQEACCMEDRFGATPLIRASDKKSQKVTTILIKAHPEAMAIEESGSGVDNPLTNTLKFDPFDAAAMTVVLAMLRDTPPEHLMIPAMEQSHPAHQIVQTFMVVEAVLKIPTHMQYNLALNIAFVHGWLYLLDIGFKHNPSIQHTAFTAQHLHGSIQGGTLVMLHLFLKAHLLPQEMSKEEWIIALSRTAYNGYDTLFQSVLKKALEYNLPKASFNTVLKTTIGNGYDAGTAALIKMGACLSTSSLTIHRMLHHAVRWKRSTTAMMIRFWHILGPEHMRQLWQSLPPPPKRSIRIARNHQALLNATTPPFIKIFVWGRNLAFALIPFLGPQSTLALACTSLQCKALYSFDRRAPAQCITPAFVDQHLLHKPTSTVVDTQGLTP